MTIGLGPLRRIDLYEEPNGSFAVDHSGTPGDFLPVPAQEGSMSWTPDRALLDPNLLQQYIHGRTLKVHGPRAASVSMTLPLAKTGTLADASTASLGAADSAFYRALKIAFGGIVSGQQGSTVASAADAHTITVAAGHGTRFVVGGAICWINSAGQMEMREIKSIAGDVLTLKHDFSAIPSVSAPIYNATSFYLHGGSSAIETSAQFIVEGAIAQDRWSIRGAQLQSIAINLPMGDDVPTLQLTWQACEYEYLGSGSLAGATYSNYLPIAFNHGELLVQSLATTARNIVKTPQITLNLGLSYIPLKSGDGTNTVFGYLQKHTPNIVSGDFQTYYEDQTWFDAWTNRTLKNISLNIMGTDFGILLAAPACQIGPVTSPQSILDGILGHTVSFEGGLDQDTADQSNTRNRSAFRAHIGG